MAGMAVQARRRKPPQAQVPRPSRRRQDLPAHYWDLTHRPLQCLVFLLPMVLAYEVGMALTHGSLSLEVRPAALASQQLLYWFFSLFGATGGYLPGFALILILLVWHVAAHHAWRISSWGLLGMAGESVILAIPILLLNDFLPGRVLEAVTQGGPRSSIEELLLCIGAGIYEELVFRLIVISLLTLLLIDILRVRQVTGVALAVIISSLLFSAHHYAPIGNDAWSAGSFAFRAAAGAYLAAVFVVRGFGLAVGCHAFYDLIAFTLDQGLVPPT